MSKCILKITINNWDKHNADKKKHYRYFKLENRFFSDDKISNLNATETRLYLYLLTVAADLNQGSYTLNTQMIPRYFSLRTQMIHRCITRLVENQLVTIAKNPSNINEMKINEDKLNEVKGERSLKIKKNKTLKSSDEDLPDQKNVSHLIALYCDRWKVAYKVTTNPIIQKSDAGKLKNLIKTIGYSKSELVVLNYLQMGDSWFVTKRHDISTMLANLNSIVQFSETKKIVTKAEINQLDKSITNSNTLEALRKGEI